MATQFDSLRDASIGSDIGDTVTVGGVEYVKTAGQEGSNVTSRLVPKQASTSSSSQASSSTSSSAGSGSSGISSEYLKQEGPLTYGKLTVDNLREREGESSVESIRNSDRHTIHSDGTISFTDTDGEDKWVPQSADQASVDLSSIDPDVLQKAADLTYLSQNTGVAISDMNAVYISLGIDPNDQLNFTKKNAILKAAGYTPGDSVNFYGNNTAADVGAQILVEGNARRPSDQDLIDAGMDPNEISVVNSNVANAYYLEQKLAERGLDASSTAGRVGSTTAFLTGENRNIEDLRLEQDALIQKYKPDYKGSAYQLDMLEWDLLKKKKEEPVVSDVYQKEPTTAYPSAMGQFDVPAGVNVPVQAIPETVTQQVTPPSYYNQPVPTTTKRITDEQAGTFSKQLQTAGLSAVPATATYKTHYAGTPGLVDPTLYAPVGGGSGPQQVIYENNLGQQMTVTEVNGTPTTYVPPGFVRKGTMQEIMQAQQQGTALAQGGAVRGYADGGDVALVKLARMNGFKGDDVATARAFMNASEGLRNKVKAMGSLKKPGTVYANDGISLPTDLRRDEATGLYLTGTGANTTRYEVPEGFDYEAYQVDPTNYTVAGIEEEPAVVGETQPPFPVQQAQRTQNLITQTSQPIQAPVSYQQPVAADFIPVDAGQATPIAPYAEAATVGAVQQATQQDTPTAATVDFTPAYTQVAAETADLAAAQGTVSDKAQVTAQQQTTSAITGMQGAQGVSTDVVAPAPRDLQTGELIDPVADAASAAAFTEQIQAATATPSAQATVQGQLEGLMQQFEGGETPAWAAGSMRTAMATLSARGLGASSLAGQAVIQATMEAALPIAQMDAQVQAQFESQNLTNRQQRAMLSAQQRATFLGMEFDQAFQARVQNSARIGDIANMNFSAEQNIALENARAANTMNLNNLSNRQAMVMAEAAALSNLDMANLNNRQQAAVQNAQSFLQMDMTNLSNDQQTAIFKSQQNVQALFTDQAAENAAEQFNASSQNQTDQYFANLRSQTSQFNASQQNAMDQFNVNSVNALREFNSEIQQQRDLFNAQNGLLIAQANAQWRQTVSTANTAAQNESNMNFAKTINALTATNLDAYWQKERDIMSFAYASGESAADRVATILQTQLETEAKAQLADAQGEGGLLATIVKGGLNYMASGGNITRNIV